MSLHHTFLVNPEELDFGSQLFFRFHHFCSHPVLRCLTQCRDGGHGLRGGRKGDTGRRRRTFRRCPRAVLLARVFFSIVHSVCPELIPVLSGIISCFTSNCSITRRVRA